MFIQRGLKFIHSPITRNINQVFAKFLTVQVIKNLQKKIYVCTLLFEIR